MAARSARGPGSVLYGVGILTAFMTGVISTAMGFLVAWGIAA